MRRIRRVSDTIVRLLLIVIAVAIGAYVGWRVFLLPSAPGVANIAHAGGQIGQQDYTNSISALDLNYRRGFRIFEIDFSMTRDGVTVCSHDWDEFDGTAPDFTMFLQWRATLDYPPCTVDELREWMASHPKTTMVTDAKDSVLNINRELNGVFGGRMIAQAYHARQVCEFWNSGIERVILTVYRLPDDIGRLRRELAEPCLGDGTLHAVTMSADRIINGHGIVAKYLTRAPVYAHTVNACFAYYVVRAMTADAIYTDTLAGHECTIWPE